MSLPIQSSGSEAWQVRFALRRCLMVWWFVFFPLYNMWDVVRRNAWIVQCPDCCYKWVPEAECFWVISLSSQDCWFCSIRCWQLAGCAKNCWAFKTPLIYSLSLPVLWQTLWGSQKVRQSLEMSWYICPKIFAGIRAAPLVPGPVQEGSVAACQPLRGPWLQSVCVLTFKWMNNIVKANKDIHVPGTWFVLCSAFS